MSENDENASTTTASVRTGRRRKKRPSPATAKIPQLPRTQLRSPFQALMPLSEEQLDEIHEFSMRLLEEQGIEVMGKLALQKFKAAGANVSDEGIVRMDRELVMQSVSTAPETFDLEPRNKNNIISCGGDAINFGLVSGPPNVHDCVDGRRAGNINDYKKLIQLGQHFNVITFFGNQALAPTDLAVNTRHLDTTYYNLVLADKAMLATGIGGGRARDAVELNAIAKGMSLDEIQHVPSVMTNININSPRKLDDSMAYGAMQMAMLGQATVVTPFTLMGAMTPATMAGALVQQNAEALLGISLVQLTRPGAPVVYGAFTSNVDMRSGAPAFGTPENALANIASGQLARRYNLPYRTSACNASNTTDSQGTWETQMSLWSAVNMSKMLQPIKIDMGEIGLEAIEEVGPGGHFFGCDHTMQRFKSAFYEPMLSDWQNQENWQMAGAKDATARATEIWQKALKEYEEPAIDPGVKEALSAYVAKRKESLGRDEPMLEPVPL